MQRLILPSLIVLCSCLLHAQQWQTYDTNNSPIVSIQAINDITVDPVRNDTWFAAGTHIYQRKKDGAWDTYNIEQTIGLTTGCIGVRDGQAWAGPRFEQSSQFTDKLSHFNGTTWQAITVAGAQISYVIDIELSENRVWIAHSKGLLQYDGTTWTTLNYQNKINQVTSLSWEATTQKLWIGVNCAPNGNVFKYDVNQNSWAEYLLGNYKCVHAVQALPDGNAYAGSANLSGLTAIKNEQVTPTIQSGFIMLDGAAANPFKIKEVWFASEFTDFENQQGIRQGLILYNGNTIARSFNSTNSEMKGNSVAALAVQQINATTATVWMKTSGTAGGPFIETYTYTNPENDINSFQFLNLPGEAQINDDEISIELPPNTDLSRLVAVFTTSPGAIVKVGNTIQTSGVTENNFSTPVTYSVTSATGETRSYRVSVSIASGADGNDITSFRFLNLPAETQITGEEISAALPPNTNLSRLVAVFTASPGATVRVGNTIQTSGVTENNFSTPITYSITSATGKTRSYRVSVSIISGIEDEIEKGNDILLFPVPAKDYLTIKIPNNFERNTPIQLTIYSMLGKVLESLEATAGKEVVLNTVNWGNGIFILKINDRTYKIMVTKS
jgi:Secretion system C-terminal sorting domain